MRKILIYSSSVLLLLVALAIAAGFLFKDKILGRFVEAANKHLATPVKIGKMEISLLSHFPEMSLEFKDVYVEDSHPEIFPLFTAKKISFSFNALDAWNGKYSIQSLNISESETNIRINKKNVGNFQILKDTVGGGKTVSLDLKNVRLKNQRITYIDQAVGHSHEVNSSSLAADVKLEGDLYSITASGDAITNQIAIGTNVFLKDKLFNFKLGMTYHDGKKEIVFLPSSIDQESGEFELAGKYNYKNEATLALTLDGKKTNIQTILSFLPESMASSVKKYESDGDLYFKMDLNGRLAAPKINIVFGSRKATIFHPETKFKITEANLEGVFTNTGFSKFSNATLDLKNVSGMLNDKNFNGDFAIKNFERPMVDFHFKGALDAATVKALIGDEYLKTATGTLLADVSLSGETDLLKDKTTAQQVKISGSLEMKDVSLSTRLKGVDLRDLNGHFHFTNNDLAMSDVGGKLRRSDFLMNGFFKNIVSYLLFPEQPIGIETDLKSDFIDVNELLQLGFVQGANEQYQFQISPNLHLNFDCQVKRLAYLRFNAEAVNGNLLVKNQTALTKGFQFKTMGGNIKLAGSIAAFGNKPIELSTSAKLNSIYVDSLFYIFENFRQDFIQDKNLKGRATADVTLETKFTPTLDVISESLVANIDVVIKNGELNNFAPLQELKKYLDDDGLKNMRFADLKNEIHIENQTVLVPLMEIKSNVTTIQLSGRHTFDQHIDYRIVAPLYNKKKINLAEAGDAYEDLAGKMKVYFKITGTTDNYKVAYDTDAVKKKLTNELKKEFAELKDAFNDKGKKKKKQLELEKDDYFDWEN